MTLPVWLYGALGVHCVSPQPSRDVRVWGRCLPAAPYVGASQQVRFCLKSLRVVRRFHQGDLENPADQVISDPCGPGAAEGMLLNAVGSLPEETKVILHFLCL